MNVSHLPIWRTVVLGAVLSATLVADDQSQPTTIEGWGKVVDPDRDCRIDERDGVVVITLPAGDHDHWYGQTDPAKRANTPRIMQLVEGDFTAQVKVTADWSLGERLEGALTHVHGAGLLVRLSDDHYFRHERMVYQKGDSPVYTFATPIYDQGNKRQNQIRGAVANEFYQGDSTWLRLTRTGQTFRTSMSHDGGHWEQTNEIVTTLPSKLFVGVHALSASSGVFRVEFADWKLTKN